MILIRNVSGLGWAWPFTRESVPPSHCFLHRVELSDCFDDTHYSSVYSRSDYERAVDYSKPSTTIGG